MTIRTWLAAALLLLPVTAATAQPHGPDLAKQKAAMNKLAFLVGNWSGDVRVAMGPGEPKNLKQTEQVQFKLDGLVLLIEGTSHDPQSGAVGFNALATVAWDEETQTYRFRAYNSGNYLDTALTVVERGFEWSYAMGPATVKNVMRIDEKGEWSETTDVTLPGRPPMRSVEIHVHK